MRVGQIGLGGPILVLECFKLENDDSIFNFSFSVLQMGCSRLETPNRVPRSAPKLRKGGVVPATQSRSSATRTPGRIARSQPSKTPSANRPVEEKATEKIKQR